MAREVVSDAADPDRNGNEGQFLSALAREVVSDTTKKAIPFATVFLSALAGEVVSDPSATPTPTPAEAFLSALAREVVSDEPTKTPTPEPTKTFLSALAREVVSDNDQNYTLAVN